jgi:hypothetical protein
LEKKEKMNQKIARLKVLATIAMISLIYLALPVAEAWAKPK